MMRRLLALTILATSTSIATACPPFFWVPIGMYYPPVYQPVYSPIVMLPAPPVQATALPAPKVYRDTPAAQPAAALEKPAAIPAPNLPTESIKVEPVKPSGFIPPAPAEPIKPVEFKAVPPATRPVEPITTQSQQLPTPRLDVPPIALKIPETDKPKEPATAPTIPPLVPKLPAEPSGLAPLKLPTPVESAPETTISESKSSPLTGTGPTPSPRAVDVLPVDGPAPTGTMRKVGFFNLSGRELTLTVQGETVKMPKMGFVSATVPASFTWSMDGKPSETTEVPAGAPGVEVVIRR